MSSNWQITDEELLHADEFFTDAVEHFEPYSSMDFEEQVSLVADRIFNIHMGRNISGEFLFSFECSADRSELQGATVAVSLNNGNGYLTQFIDMKYLTEDRDAVGAAQAVAIKDRLMSAYATARTIAVSAGLVTA